MVNLPIVDFEHMHTPHDIDTTQSPEESLTPFIKTADNDIVPLHAQVELAVHRYFEALDGEEASNLYTLFLAEFEKPLLLATLKYARGNQSKTAQILGLNRGTLRTKLKHYGLL